MEKRLDIVYRLLDKLGGETSNFRDQNLSQKDVLNLFHQLQIEMTQLCKSDGKDLSLMQKKKIVEKIRFILNNVSSFN